MKLTRIFLFAIIGIAAVTRLNAQNNCTLPIMVEVMDTDGTMSEKSLKLLDAKLRHLVSVDGIGSKSPASHLCLTATVTESGDRQVISGNRPVVTGSYDVTLVLSNIISGENFGSESITLHGAGNNDAAQKQAAVAQLNPSDAALRDFILHSHAKVMDYYAGHLPAIIDKARVFSQLGEYDKALYLLSTVPPCVESYQTVTDAMLSTYQDYLDLDCNKKLMAARAVWAADKSGEGAAAAAAYLAAIDHRSACYEGALDLLGEISDRLDENLKRLLAQEDEDRALQQELIRNDVENERRNAENDYNLRQQEIETIRQIGLAYGSSLIPDAGKPASDGASEQQKGLAKPFKRAASGGLDSKAAKSVKRK